MRDARAPAPGHRRRWRPLTGAAVVLIAALAVLLPGGAARADTVRQMQWYLRELKIDQVHAISTGRGVTVGLIDTGVETSHPDLRGKVRVGPRFDSARSSRSSTDVDGHGTSMAGVIAGRGGGENHALGIAPDATVLSVQGAGEGRTNVANRAAMVWAVDHGATVLNLSFGSRDISDDMRQAVAYALRKDVVVVASVGNTYKGQSEVISPASIPGVVAVSGTTRGGGFWTGSASGPETVLSAPGDGIVSTASRAAGSKTGYSSGFGTSDSAAIVSGAAALVRAKYPRLKAPDIINRLIRTADDAGPSGRDPRYGFGRLDILKALTANVSHVSANPLGDPAAGRPTAAQPPVEDLATASGLSGKAVAGFGIIGLACLAVILVPIYLVVSARRRRRLAQRGGLMAAQGYSPAGWQSPGRMPEGHPQAGTGWPAGYSPGADPPPQVPQYPPAAAQYPLAAQPPAGQYPLAAQPPAGQYPLAARPSAAQYPLAAQPPAAQYPLAAQPPAAQYPPGPGRGPQVPGGLAGGPLQSGQPGTGSQMPRRGVSVQPGRSGVGPQVPMAAAPRGLSGVGPQVPGGRGPSGSSQPGRSGADAQAPSERQSGGPNPARPSAAGPQPLGMTYRSADGPPGRHPSGQPPTQSRNDGTDSR